MSAREQWSDRQHLSEDVLMDAIYGIAGQEAEAHLRACPDCAGRLNERKQMRATSTGELTGDFLAAQRRAIYQRIEAKPSRARVWAPVLAAACALAVGVFLYHPKTVNAPVGTPVASVEVNDAQLFTEVFSMEQSLEPSAVASVRVLFEEQQQ